MSAASLPAAENTADDNPLTLPRLLRRNAARHGERVLMVVDGEQLTYAQAETRSRLLARALIAQGVTKGAHVAMLHPNGADYIIGLFAVGRIGAVLVPLSTFSTAEELGWLLSHSDASFLLASQRYRSRDYVRDLKSAIPELDLAGPPEVRSGSAPWLRRIWFRGRPEGARGWSIEELEDAASSVDEERLAAIEARVSPADRLIIIHTSGSTSTPKAVMHTHGALIGHYGDVSRIRGFTFEDRMFSPSPWFWVAGFSALLGVIIAGGGIVCSNSTVASEVLDLLERARPNTTNGFWSMVERLAADPSFARRDFSFIRGGNLYPIMAPDVRARDPELRHGNYGMSEVGGTLTMSGDESDLPERLRGSFGSLTPGFETRIVDAETGRDCGAGEVGELWIRGPNLMEGYYGKPRSEVFQPDGWWKSGDLGCFDAEGNFHFKARRGDMIKTSGANVAPREVEAVLRTVSGGLPAMVVGVPDAQRGQIVVGVVVSNDAAAVDEAALRQALSQKLSAYKVPRRIIRLAEAELPLLSSGKVDLRRFAALVAQKCAPGPGNFPS
jgi:acyl-CoA synthetase (AMP-forming)/AMP-acid ligase II